MDKEPNLNEYQQFIENEPNNVNQQPDTQENIPINAQNIQNNVINQNLNALNIQNILINQNVNNNVNISNKIRQIEIAFYKYLIEFINYKIRTTLNLTDQVLEQMNLKLYDLEPDQKYRTSIHEHRILFGSTIGEFLSAEISSKYPPQIPRNHNRTAIQALMLNPNLNNLFSLSYIECFGYFRGDQLVDQRYHCLEGLNNAYFLFILYLLAKGYDANYIRRMITLVKFLDIYLCITTPKIRMNQN